MARWQKKQWQEARDSALKEAKAADIRAGYRQRLADHWQAEGCPQVADSILSNRATDLEDAQLWREVAIRLERLVGLKAVFPKAQVGVERRLSG